MGVLATLKGTALILTKGAKNAFVLRTRRPNNTIPVPTFQPVYDNPMGFDLMPKGTPQETQWGMCWLDICNADVNAGDGQVFGFHAYSDRMEIQSWGTGGTLGKPIKIVMNGVVAMTINADGSVEIPNLTVQAMWS